MSEFPKRKISRPNFEPLSESVVFINNINKLRNLHDGITYKKEPGHTKWMMFGQGKKDNWCVYIFDGRIKEDGRKELFCYIPKDIYYFERISWLGSALQDYGISSEMVYGHFYYIYALCSLFKKNISELVINQIKAIVNQYYVPLDGYTDFCLSEMVLEQFLLIYTAMVAEEFYVRPNKQPTLFGCTIKMLALHEILITHRPYKEVARKYNCTTGEDILREASRVGIVRL